MWDKHERKKSPRKPFGPDEFPPVALIRPDHWHKCAFQTKRIKSNEYTRHFHIFSYDLDPDDGYGGRVVLPYETYYTKDYKSTSASQSTMQSSHLPKPTWKPYHNPYKFKSNGHVNTLDPYELAVTTHDTHQHLTETTPIQPIRNITTPRIEFKPIKYSSVISSTSSKPLTEVLQNMNRTSLQFLLAKLKESNYLPQSFTMNKLDNSLRTLAKSRRPTTNHISLSTRPPALVTDIYAPNIETISNDYDEDVESNPPPKQLEGKH